MARAEQRKKLPVPALVGIIAAVVVIALLAAYCGLCKWVQDNGRLLPGAQAQNGEGAVVLELGGLSQQEAVEQVAAYMDGHLEQRTLTLRYGEGKSAQLSGSLLSSDPQAAVNVGMEAKAAQPFLKLGLLWLGLGSEPVELSLSASSFTPEGEQEAKRLVERIADELYVAPVDFTYEIEGEELKLTTGVDGVEVDTEALLEQVRQALAAGETELTVETQPAPSKELTGEILAELVYVEPQASQLQEDGTLSPTVTGVSLDAEEAQAILDATAPGETCTIPVTITQPELDESAQYLFRDKLSSVTTPLDGVASRSYNVALAASSCNGTVIMPGQVFSYLGTIGNPSTENGYKMSTGYSNGETVDMVGGGVCQVSSCIYYCTVYANLEIVKRAAHAFTTGYIPNGLDATVYYPSLDYKFRNNTDYPIKIVAGVSGNYLTVSFYGTKTDDSYVTTQRYTISTTPRSTVYTPAASVPLGTTKVKTTPYTGYEVEVYRCVYDGNGNLISRTYENYSKYSKRDKVILFNPADAGSLGLAPDGTPLPDGPVDPTPPVSEEPTPPVSTEPTPPASEEPTTPPTAEPTPPASEQPTTPPTAEPTTPPTAEPTPAPTAEPTTPPSQEQPPATTDPDPAATTQG